MSEGTVRRFCPRRGFGFIATDCGRDVFCHYSAISAQGFKSLNPGDRVELDIYELPCGRYVAKNIRKLR